MYRFEWVSFLYPYPKACKKGIVRITVYDTLIILIRKQKTGLRLNKNRLTYKVNPIDGIPPLPYICDTPSCYFICDNHNNRLTTYPPFFYTHTILIKIAILPKGNMAISFYNK